MDLKSHRVGVFLHCLTAMRTSGYLHPAWADVELPYPADTSLVWAGRPNLLPPSQGMRGTPNPTPAHMLPNS